MFERFTDRARLAMVLAQEEAHLLNHDYIGTEHLLLGLVQAGDSVGAQTLEALGVTLEAVRAKVVEHLGPATSGPASSPPFTQGAKKVLELSLREALQMSHNYIGTEHLLLGLMREGDGVAHSVLVELGLSLEQVRAEVLRLLAADPPGEVTDRPGRPWLERDPVIRASARTASGAAECPGCRIDLGDTLRWRIQTVPAGQPGDPAREVTVWWCRACGRTISVTPEGAPRQSRGITVPDAIPESEEVRVQFLRQGRPVAGLTGDLGTDWISGPVEAEGAPPPRASGQESVIDAVLDLLRADPGTEAARVENTDPSPGDRPDSRGRD